MRRWVWLAIWLLPAQAFALEIPLTSGGALSLGIPIRITTVEGDPVTAQTLATIDLYYACSGQTRTLFNEVGDTLPEIDPTAYPGDYYLVSNDVLTACTPPNVMQVRGTGTDLVISAPLVEVVFPEITGSVVSSVDCTNSATQFDTSLTESQSNHWTDAFLTFTSGVLSGQTKPVTVYNGTTKCVTVRAPGFSTTPSANDTFRLVNK